MTEGVIIDNDIKRNTSDVLIGDSEMMTIEGIREVGAAIIIDDEEINGEDFDNKPYWDY